MGKRYLADWEKHLIPEAGRFPNQTVLELGVGKGHSALWFMEHVLPLADGQYIGIDKWGKSRYWLRTMDRCRRNLAPFRRKAELFKGAIENVLPTIEGPFHLVYIDAAKDIESVTHYSELVWPHVPPGGLVIWNEYRNQNHQTVMKAVERIKDSWNYEDELSDGWNYDVVWAHDQLCVRKR